MPSDGIVEKLTVWNNRRIEKRRLRAPFRKTSHGFEYRGISVQYTDDWERHERALIETLLGRVDRFVNVGAHYGFYACLARSRGVPVIALEPVDANFRMLMDNLQHNGFEDDAILIHSAAGPAPGIAEITGVFSGGTLTANSKKPASLSQKTPVVPLDAVVPVSDGQTLVVMDVEGFEFEALSGATALLAAPGRVSWLIEIVPSTTNRDGVLVENANYRATFGMMFDAGYQAWLIDETSRRLGPEEIEAAMARNPADRPIGNVLFMAAEADISEVIRDRAGA